MFVLLNAALISLIQIVVLTLSGLGLAWLFTPAHLRAYRLLLAPAFGMALLSLIGFYGTNTGYSLRQLAPVAAGVALLFLALAWVQQRHTRPAQPVPYAAKQSIGQRHRLQRRIEWVTLPGMLLAIWFLHVALMMSYGILMPIGHNADVEFYLPLADYLQDYSYAALPQIPVNVPRAVLLGNESYTMRAMGGTYIQGTIDLLGGWYAWESWVPMLATFRIVSLVGLYVLLRGGLTIGSQAAQTGVALAGINGLLLWTTYNNYGMSTAATALLPVVGLWTLLALERGGRRAVTGGAFLLGGMTCVYWPILLAYGALGAGVAIGLLWEQRHSPGVFWRILRRGLLLLAGAGMISWLAHVRLPHSWLGDFTIQPASMGITTFFSPPVIVGTAPAPGALLPIYRGIWETMAWGGVWLAGVLLVWAIGQHPGRRALLIGLALCSLLFLGGLRFVLAYPYGYVRGASYIAPVLLGIIGSGITGGIARVQRVPSPPLLWLRWAMPGIGLLLLALCVTASYHISAAYARQPGFASVRSAHERAAAVTLDKAGAVLFSPAAASILCGSPTMAWGNAFYQREMIGIFHSTYTTLDNLHTGTNPAYYVLEHTDDVAAYGLEQAAPVWHSERVVVYARPDSRTAWLDGRIPERAMQPLCVRGDTTYTRAQLGHAPYIAAQPDEPLTLYAAANQLALEPLTDQPATQGKRTVAFELATVEAQQITLLIDGQRKVIDLPAGVSTYHTPPLDLPAHVTIADVEEVVLLRQAHLREPETTGESPVAAAPDTVFIALASETTEQGAIIDLDMTNTSPHVLRLVLEIYEDVGGYETTPHHYAQAVLPRTDQLTLQLDLLQPALEVNGESVPLTIDQPQDGTYFASVWVYQGEALRQRIPLVHFERHLDRVEGAVASEINGVVLPVTTPAHTLDVEAAGVILQSYELEHTIISPGEQFQVALLWQTEQGSLPLYAVTVQVLDAANTKIAQWDGAAGGDGYPSSRWQVGERIWQNVPLTIAADALPGEYRVIAGVYDPLTGERLPLDDGTDAVELGIVKVIGTQEQQ